MLALQGLGDPIVNNGTSANSPHPPTTSRIVADGFKEKDRLTIRPSARAQGNTIRTWALPPANYNQLVFKTPRSLKDTSRYERWEIEWWEVEAREGENGHLLRSALHIPRILTALNRRVGAACSV